MQDSVKPHLWVVVTIFPFFFFNFVIKRKICLKKKFLDFVVALFESIHSHKLFDPCHQSKTINSIVSILETLIQWINEIPLAQQSSCYSNLSCRTWHSCLTETSDLLMLQILTTDLQSATIDIIPYFTDSFENSSWIDYGTGHETNFAAWLYCLARLGVIKEEDYHAVVARVFVKYLELMRKLQLVYCLEPCWFSWRLGAWWLSFLVVCLRLIAGKGERRRRRSP